MLEKLTLNSKEVEIMNFNQKIGLHNEFRIEVRDKDTGELKQVGYAHNIVLNKMYTRLCSFQPFFEYIAYGTGTGTLAPTRTSLFTHLGMKACANVSSKFDLTNNNSYRQRKITLNPEENVGATLTEVGVAYGNSSSYLVTHAMIKDAEGNPISITKTAVDVMVIYATIYFVFSTDNTGIRLLDKNNTLANYLISGSTVANHYLDYGTSNFEPSVSKLKKVILGEALNNNTSTSVYKLTWTANTTAKTTTSNKVRMPITDFNGKTIREIGVRLENYRTGMFRVTLPATGIWAGLAVVDKLLGVGDGSLVKFTVPNTYIDESSLTVKVGGVLQVKDTDYTIIQARYPYEKVESNPAIPSVYPQQGNPYEIDPDYILFSSIDSSAPSLLDVKEKQFTLNKGTVPQAYVLLSMGDFILTRTAQVLPIKVYKKQGSSYIEIPQNQEFIANYDIDDSFGFINKKFFGLMENLNNGSRRINVYEFDPITGQVSPTVLYTAGIGNGSIYRKLVFDKFLFVVYRTTSSDIYLYKFMLDPDTGSISSSSTILSNIIDTVASPNNSYLYAQKRNTPLVVKYNIDQDTGALSNAVDIPLLGYNLSNYSAFCLCYLDFSDTEHYLMVSNPSYVNNTAQHVLQFIKLDPITGDPSGEDNDITLDYNGVFSTSNSFPENMIFLKSIEGVIMQYYTVYYPTFYDMSKKTTIVKFLTPPAQDAQVTASYNVPGIPKDADHVLDVQFTIQWGEQV